MLDVITEGNDAAEDQVASNAFPSTRTATHHDYQHNDNSKEVATTSWLVGGTTNAILPSVAANTLPLLLLLVVVLCTEGPSSSFP